MVKQLDVIDFLAAPGAIVDVRSPGEYQQGNLPSAANLPLFTNEERARIGTLYKQQGPEPAFELGLQIVGPKLHTLVTEAKKSSIQNALKVHCWRGGMRSRAVADLLETSGLSVCTLKGGYKAFRTWVLNTLQKPKKLMLIGGLTGTGKTAILKNLKERGEQVLDLESLASHRGSSYGMIGMPPQPTNEQFENEIAIRWNHFDAHKTVWIEDESRMIGTCKIPDALFERMQRASLQVIDRPMAERFKILEEGYSPCLDKNAFIQATERLRKRLGNQTAASIIERIHAEDNRHAMLMILDYYDRAYKKSIDRRKQPIAFIKGSGYTNEEWANQLIETLNP